MDAISYSRARQHFAKTMDRVCDEHEPVIITRQSATAVVMMSLDDYNAIQETAYLVCHPVNASRLRKSMQEYEQGLHQERDLLNE